MGLDDDDMDGIDWDALSEVAADIFAGGEPPAVTVELAVQVAAHGGLTKGRFTISAEDDDATINAVEVEVIQYEDGDEEIIGNVTFPYLGRLLAEGASITRGFVIQNSFEYGKPSSEADGVTHAIRVTVNADEGVVEDEATLAILDQKADYAEEEFNEYHYIDAPTEFLNSSVRGELRIFGFEGGFVISWNDRISVRRNTGERVWGVTGPGRTLALSPDGATLVAVSDPTGTLQFYAVESGMLLREVPAPAPYIDHLVWYDDGSAIVAAAGENDLYLLDGEGQLVRRIDADGVEFISDLAVLPGERTILIADTNASCVWRLETDDEDALDELVETYCADQLAISPDRSLFAFVEMRAFELYDDDLDCVLATDFPGRSGVRFYGQSRGSCRSWEAKLRFHPDSNQFLVNVQDGQVWLFDYCERKLTPIPRELVNWVEDTHWVGPARFAAIDSLGNLSIVDLEAGTVVFREQDYAA